MIHVEIGYTQQSRTHNMILVVMMMSGIVYYFRFVHRYSNYYKNVLHRILSMEE